MEGEVVVVHIHSGEERGLRLGYNRRVGGMVAGFHMAVAGDQCMT